MADTPHVAVIVSVIACDTDRPLAPRDERLGSRPRALRAGAVTVLTLDLGTKATKAVVWDHGRSVARRAGRRHLPVEVRASSEAASAGACVLATGWSIDDLNPVARVLEPDHDAAAFYREWAPIHGGIAEGARRWT